MGVDEDSGVEIGVVEKTVFVIVEEGVQKGISSDEVGEEGT